MIDEGCRCDVGQSRARGEEKRSQSGMGMSCGLSKVMHLRMRGLRKQMRAAMRISADRLACSQQVMRQCICQAGHSSEPTLKSELLVGDCPPILGGSGTWGFWIFGQSVTVTIQ